MRRKAEVRGSGEGDVSGSGEGVGAHGLGCGLSCGAGVSLYSGHGVAAEGFLNAAGVGQESAGSADPEAGSVVKLSTGWVNGHAAEIELDCGRCGAGCDLGNGGRAPVGLGLSCAGFASIASQVCVRRQTYPTAYKFALLLSGRSRGANLQFRNIANKLGSSAEDRSHPLP
jgi:hypothetical protein